MKKNIDKFLINVKEALLGGGKNKIDQQHAKGKLTARERIDILLDKDSFNEIGMFVKGRDPSNNSSNNMALSDGVVTGYGTINGFPVFIFSQDFTIYGGSLGEEHAYAPP